MSGLWVRPELSEGHWTLFALFLGVSVAWQLLTSPRRRRAMGVTRFALASALVSSIPLAAVLIVRAGFRDAFLDAGYGWWSALWLSLLWMGVFTFAARFLVRRLPPTSWLLADLKLARSAAWREFLGVTPRTRGARA